MWSTITSIFGGMGGNDSDDDDDDDNNNNIDDSGSGAAIATDSGIASESSGSSVGGGLQGFLGSLLVQKKSHNQIVQESIVEMDRSIQKLQSQADEKLRQIENAHEMARAKAKARDQRQARIWLMRKKQFEQQHDAIMRQVQSFEMQKLRFDQTHSTLEVLKVQKKSERALRKVFDKIGGVDSVKDAVHQIQDTLHEANAVNEIVQQPMDLTSALSDEFSEESLDAELADLLLEDVPNVKALPTLVDTTSKTKKKKHGELAADAATTSSKKKQGSLDALLADIPASSKSKKHAKKIAA